MNLENGASRHIVVPVSLLIEFGPVTRHGCVDIFNLVHAEHLDDVIDVRNKVVDSLVKFLHNLLCQ